MLLAAGLALIAPTAGAVVEPVNGIQYGIEPANGESSGASATPMSYEGGPVVHSNNTYAVYWDPASSYPVLAQRLVSGFLKNVANEAGELSSVFGIVTQYGDSAAKVSGDASFRGSKVDSAPFPASGDCGDEGTPCLTDTQIRAQLSEYISANGLPTGLNPGVGSTPIYVVLLPPGVTVCAGSGEGGNCSDAGAAKRLCSYHSVIGENPSADLGRILYTVQPWTPVAGCQNGSEVEEPSLLRPGQSTVADVIVNEISNELLATITDPELSAWHDTGSDKDEITDKCRDEFLGLVQGAGEVPGREYNQVIGGVPYYLNDAFNQAGLYNGYTPGACVNQAALEPYFTAPSDAKSGTPVTFDASESLVSLGVTSYRWSFGDGASTEINCGTRTPTEGFAPTQCDGAAGVGSPNAVGSVTHTYLYGGTYDVTLTITDDGGHISTVSEKVTVAGPSGPSSPGSSGSSIKVFPAPVLGATILSRSLTLVAHSGLAVRYSVNERMAGRLEFLLPTSVARRMGISGATARGLPSGTPPSRIVATALLVTSRAGKSVVRIKLSSRNAARLAKLHRVPVAVRLTAHNASTNPVSTTVVRKTTLSR